MLNPWIESGVIVVNTRDQSRHLIRLSQYLGHTCISVWETQGTRKFWDVKLEWRNQFAIFRSGSSSESIVLFVQKLDQFAQLFNRLFYLFHFLSTIFVRGICLLTLTAACVCVFFKAFFFRDISLISFYTSPLFFLRRLSSLPPLMSFAESDNWKGLLNSKVVDS
jgi:hypothetical protein